MAKLTKNIINQFRLKTRTKGMTEKINPLIHGIDDNIKLLVYLGWSIGCKHFIFACIPKVPMNKIVDRIKKNVAIIKLFQVTHYLSHTSHYSKIHNS